MSNNTPSFTNLYEHISDDLLAMEKNLRSLTDSSLIMNNNTWYLFTTSDRGFEIYWSEDILNDEFKPHAMNPITSDKKFERSGGSPLLIKGKIYRFIQNCSNISAKIVKKMWITHNALIVNIL